MSDNVQQFTPHIDRLFHRDGTEPEDHDITQQEYAAFWENPANRNRPEFTLLMWDRQFNCHGIDYPFIRRLNFAKGVITFHYDGLLVTLKGRNLQQLYTRLSDHRPKHLHEFNPDYHETAPDNAPCIEAMTIEEE